MQKIIISISEYYSLLVKAKSDFIFHEFSYLKEKHWFKAALANLIVREIDQILNENTILNVLSTDLFKSLVTYSNLFFIPKSAPHTTA